MKKIIVLALTVLFAAFAVMAYAQATPERIDLKAAWNVQGSQKAAFIPHKSHAETYLKGKCDSCHTSPQGGDKIGPKLQGQIKGSAKTNSAHNFCWTCHDAQPKPNKTPGKTCTKCHTGN